MDSKVNFSKKVFLLFFCFSISLLSFSQTYSIYQHQFNTSDGWNLGKRTNKWIINQTYTCAGSFTAATPNNGNGGYLHIYSETALPLFGGNCACYNPTSISETVYANTTENICTVGFDSITITFDWLCKGNSSNYGQIQVSTDGGMNFSTLSSPISIYNNQSTWTTTTINSTQHPSLLNKPQLMIRFAFTSGATRNTPGFAIDNLIVKGYVKNNTFRLVNRYTIPELCSNSHSGSAVLMASGGSRPYTYIWKNNSNQAILNIHDSVAHNLPMGSYTVIATDNNINSDSAIVIINNIFVSPTINAGINDTICFGENHSLQASGGTYYQWNPQSEIIGSTNISNPIVQPDTTTPFVVYGESKVGEYIINGDFSQGNTNFYSDYIYYTANTQDMSEGKYTVRPDASGANSAWWQCNFLDHTPTNDGISMIVNGANIANVNVWCQTVSVTPNTNYAFATWLSSMHTQNPATLQFSINGQLLGTPFNASSNVCEWMQFYQIWNSGINTSATICIVNMNTISSGNDFALDDISFAPLCGDFDTVTIAISHPIAFAGNDTTFCGVNSVTLIASGGVHYSWNTAQNTQQISVSPSSTSTYTVTVTDNHGCTNTDQVVVSIGDMPHFFLGNDTTLCTGNSLILDATNAHINNYTWDDGSTSSFRTISSPGTYWLKGSNGCGSATDTIHVYFQNHNPINLGNDTTLCSGVAIVISASPDYSSYLWSNGTSEQTTTIATNSTLSVTVFDSLGCSSSDTIQINFLNPISIWLGNDTTLCYSDSIKISAPSGFSSYLWNTNEISQEIWVKVSGNYTLTALQNGICTSRDTISITLSSPPSLSLGNDTSVCFNSTSILLHAPENATTLEWSDGSNSSTFPINSTGSYWLKISNSDGCYNTDTIQVIFHHLNPISLGADVDFCGLPSFEIQAITIENNAFDYYWSEGSTGPQSITVNSPGKYWVSYGDTNCAVSDTIELFDCPEMIIPNVFSPNNDGYNDRFIPQAQSIHNFKMTIFNRWGDAIFQTDDFINGWDGQVNGKIASEGVYFWIIEYSEKFNSETIISRQGSVTLIE